MTVEPQIARRQGSVTKLMAYLVVVVNGDTSFGTQHPVQYCHFHGRLLIIGNVPYQKYSEVDEFESVSSLRYRGTVQFYDFLANQQRAGIPEICLSSYNEPEASLTNLGLTVPYDSF